jgi:hypothetical protein
MEHILRKPILSGRLRTGHRSFSLGVAAVLVTAFAIALFIGVSSAAAASAVDYTTQVQPIFNSQCGPCHIASASAGVQLNNYTNAKAAASLLPGMGSSYLSAAQAQVIADWVSQGALQTPPATTFTLTYTAGANGSISGASPQTVISGASGTSVSAVPATGYHFVNWSDGSTTNPRTDSGVTASKTVTASFAINTYTLTYTAGGNGSISGATPQTVNYGASGTAVNAVAATGYHFANWNDGSTANPRTDSGVTTSKTVSASFAINTYTLTYTAGGNGSISGATPQTVNYGASGTAVSAVAATGYHFTNWSDGSAANPRTDATVTANVNVTAGFAANPITPPSPVSYTLTYLVGPNGSIAGTSSQTVTSGGSGTAVTAVAATGYHFVNWSDGLTANPRIDSNVVSNVSVMANFAANPVTSYTLSYISGSNGSISGATTQTVTSGGSGTAVTAVASTGYHFVNWSDGSTSNPRTDTNVTANVNVTATFAANSVTQLPSPTTYIITASSGSHGSITPAGAVVVNSGASQTFTFKPYDGFRVAQVIVDGRSAGSSSTYTFAGVNGSHTISVTFAPITRYSGDSEDGHHYSRDNESSHRTRTGSD